MLHTAQRPRRTFALALPPGRWPGQRSRLAVGRRCGPQSGPRAQARGGGAVPRTTTRHATFRKNRAHARHGRVPGRTSVRALGPSCASLPTKLAFSDHLRARRQLWQVSREERRLGHPRPRASPPPHLRTPCCWRPRTAHPPAAPGMSANERMPRARPSMVSWCARAPSVFLHPLATGQKQGHRSAVHDGQLVFTHAGSARASVYGGLVRTGTKPAVNRSAHGPMAL